MGVLLEGGLEGICKQCPSDDAKQGQCRQDVDNQVSEMIAPDVVLADGVIDRQAERDDGPCGGRDRRGANGSGYRPERAV